MQNYISVFYLAQRAGASNVYNSQFSVESGEFDIYMIHCCTLCNVQTLHCSSCDMRIKTNIIHSRSLTYKHLRSSRKILNLTYYVIAFLEELVFVYNNLEKKAKQYDILQYLA